MVLAPADNERYIYGIIIARFFFVIMFVVIFNISMSSCLWHHDRYDNWKSVQPKFQGNIFRLLNEELSNREATN